MSKLITLTGDKETNTVRSEMQAPYRLLQASARNIAKVFKDAKLECDEEEYVKGFNAGKFDTHTSRLVRLEINAVTHTYHRVNNYLNTHSTVTHPDTRTHTHSSIHNFELFHFVYLISCI